MNYVENVVILRRKLHKIPELGWGEFKTTALIIETLEKIAGWKLFLGADQIGLDAVMGRPLDLVENHMKRAREAGVNP